jgi:hypothetical protein
MKKTYYVEYVYRVNEIEYKTKVQVNSKNGKNVGDITKIKYNPENPSEIKDDYKYYGKMWFTIFVGVFTALLWIGIIKNQN